MWAELADAPDCLNDGHYNSFWPDYSVFCSLDQAVQTHRDERKNRFIGNLQILSRGRQLDDGSKTREKRLERAGRERDVRKVLESLAADDLLLVEVVQYSGDVCQASPRRSILRRFLAR